MNTRTFWLLAIGSTIAFAAQADNNAQSSIASERRLEPNTVIADFFAACTTQDEQRLSQITTDDLRIEYALDAPGTYYAIDSLALGSECAALSSMGIDTATVRLFPTADERAVFVQYELGPGIVPAENLRQLALVELRGERIARILSFSEPANVTLSVRERSQRDDRAAMTLKNPR